MYLTRILHSGAIGTVEQRNAEWPQSITKQVLESPTWRRSRAICGRQAPNCTLTPPRPPTVAETSAFSGAHSMPISEPVVTT